MLRKSLIATLKLAACGLVIFCIGALVLVLSPEADVPDAQADLVDLIPASLLEHQDFHRVMVESGFDPQPYDHNGNLVFFAAGESEMAPTELMRYLQQKLHRAGINSAVYDQPVLGDPRALHGAQNDFLESSFADTLGGPMGKALLNGEVVPLQVQPDRIMMGGIVPRQKFDDHEEMHAYLAANPRVFTDFDEYVDTFRYIDIQAESNGGSTVTANWADSNFDPRRVHDPRAVDVRLDLEVPACIGCTRLNRFDSLEGRPFTFNQFETAAPDDTIHDFYTQVMADRGWELSATDQILAEFEHMVPELQNLSGFMLNFEKGDRFASFYINRNPRTLRTSVVSIHGE